MSTVRSICLLALTTLVSGCRPTANPPGPDLAAGPPQPAPVVRLPEAEARHRSQLDATAEEASPQEELEQTMARTLYADPDYRMFVCGDAPCAADPPEHHRS